MKNFIYGSTICIFALVVIFPFGMLVFNAFEDPGTILTTYQHVFQSVRVHKLIQNSLWISVGSTLVALLIGVPVGWMMARTSLWGKGFWKALLLLPLILPPHIQAVAWINILGPKRLASELLSNHFGIERQFWSLYSIGGCIFILGVSYFPFISWLVMTGLEQVDKRLEEMGHLYADRWDVLRRIMLPLVGPFIGCGALFVGIINLVNYSVPSLLGVNTYPVEIFAQFSAFYDHQKAILLSFPFFMITTALLLLAFMWLKTRRFYNISGVQNACDSKHQRLSMLCLAVIFIFFMGAPLMILFRSAETWKSFQVAWKTSLKPIVSSITLSAGASTLCVILAFFLGQLIVRLRGFRSKAVEIVSLWPLAFPPTVLGIALIRLWNHPQTQWVYGNYTIIIFALLAQFIPFSTYIMTSCFRQIPPSLDEAAQLSGAGFWSAVGKILFPMSWRGCRTAWIVCFIMCMGEINAGLLVMPAGTETLSSKIYNLMHYGVGKLTSALSLIMIGVTLSIIIIIHFIFEILLRPSADFAHD